MARPQVYSPEVLWRRQVVDAFGGASLDPSATTGFLYVPAMDGAPVGTPDEQPGRAALVVDSTNDQLYFYSNGAWHGVP